MDRKPLEWETEREFEGGVYVVAVRRARAGRWSRWSLQVGVRRDGHDRLGLFIGVFEDRSGGPSEGVVLQDDISGTIASLLVRAEDYIKEEMTREKAENSQSRWSPPFASEGSAPDVQQRRQRRQRRSRRDFDEDSHGMW